MGSPYASIPATPLGVMLNVSPPRRPPRPQESVGSCFSFDQVEEGEEVLGKRLDKNNGKKPMIVGEEPNVVGNNLVVVKENQELLGPIHPQRQLENTNKGKSPMIADEDPSDLQIQPKNTNQGEKFDGILPSKRKDSVGEKNAKMAKIRNPFGITRSSPQKSNSPKRPSPTLSLPLAPQVMINKTQLRVSEVTLPVPPSPPKDAKLALVQNLFAINYNNVGEQSGRVVTRPQPKPQVMTEINEYLPGHPLASPAVTALAAKKPFGVDIYKVMSKLEVTSGTWTDLVQAMKKYDKKIMAKERLERASCKGCEGGHIVFGVCMCQCHSTRNKIL